MFLHFASTESDRSDKIAFQGGGPLPRPTTRWKGAVRLGDDWTITIPPRFGAGKYEILVGLWDPATGTRYRLLGDEDGTMRFRLGTLVAQGDSDEVTEISVIPRTPKPSTVESNIARGPIDFGPVRTDGAFRCQIRDNTIVVTPLPDLGPFLVDLHLAELTIVADRRIRRLTAVDREGKTLRTVDYRRSPDRLEFETRAGEFAYTIGLEE